MLSRYAVAHIYSLLYVTRHVSTHPGPQDGAPTRVHMDEAQAFVTKYDKNKDGKLDLDELSEAIAAMSEDKQFFALNPLEKEREETDIG